MLLRHQSASFIRPRSVQTIGLPGSVPLTATSAFVGIGLIQVRSRCADCCLWRLSYVQFVEAVQEQILVSLTQDSGDLLVGASIRAILRALVVLWPEGTQGVGVGSAASKPLPARSFLH